MGGTVIDIILEDWECKKKFLDGLLLLSSYPLDCLIPWAFRTYVSVVLMVSDVLIVQYDRADSWDPLLGMSSLASKRCFAFKIKGAFGPVPKKKHITAYILLLKFYHLNLTT